VFAERAKGPSGIDWRAGFSQYKCIILHLLPAYHSWLLAWYNEHLFSRPTTSAVQTNLGTSESGFDEIEDLIQWLGDADVNPSTITLSFASPSSQHPASPPLEGDAAMSEPNVPDVPLTGAVENETFVRSEAKKKATRVPRARHVQLRKRGANAS